MFVNRKVLEEKEDVARFVENTRMILQSFDQKFHQRNRELQEREQKWYDEQTEQLNQSKKRLHELRLQGDSFLVQVQAREMLLEITDEGTIIFFEIAYTDNPVVPQDMSKLSHFRIQEVKELVCRPGCKRLYSDKSYEVLTSRLVRHISDVYRFRRCEIPPSPSPPSSTFPSFPSSSSPSSPFSFSSRGSSSSRGSRRSSPSPSRPSPSHSPSHFPSHFSPTSSPSTSRNFSPLLSPFASAFSAISSSTFPFSSPTEPSPPPRDPHHRPPSRPSSEPSPNCYENDDDQVRQIQFQVHWKSNSITFKVFDHPEELEEVLGAQLQRFNRSFVAQVEEIKTRWNQSQIGYDITNEDHEKQLLHLWDIVFPNDPLISRKSKQWSDIGFQGKDPATDFRGMGLLGLSLLVFFCETHTERVQSILKADRSYPFAVFGIHLANFLLSTMLGVSAKTVTAPSLDRKIWESPLLNFFISVNKTDAFEETFCQVFFLFDALWVKMKATYMDFPKVQKALKAELTTLLERLPLGMKQLSAWVDQVVVSILHKEEEEDEDEETINQRALSDEFQSLTSLVFASPKLSPESEDQNGEIEDEVSEKGKTKEEGKEEEKKEEEGEETEDEIVEEVSLL